MMRHVLSVETMRVVSSGGVMKQQQVNLPKNLSLL